MQSILFARLAQRRLCLACTLALVIPLSAAATPPTVTCVLKEGDTVTYNTAPFTIDHVLSTAVNHASGFGAMLQVDDGTSTFSAVWVSVDGSAPGLRLITHPDDENRQVSFESTFGLSNYGVVAASALLARSTCGEDAPGHGFLDSLWTDDERLYAEGEPFGSYHWRFLSHPGMTADGRPYWVGGIASAGNVHPDKRGLFLSNGASAVLLSGRTLSGLPAPLAPDNTVGAFAVSAMAHHTLAAVKMQATTGPQLATGSEYAMVLDGHGLSVGGQLIRSGSAVPITGAGSGEIWKRFRAAAVTEGEGSPRAWAFAATTKGATVAAQNEVVVRNGTIVMRKGVALDGHVPTGQVNHLAMNESGDLVIVCKVDAMNGTPGVDAMYLNGTVIAMQGSTIPLGAGQTGKLTNIKGLNTVSVSDRRPDGSVSVYFVANVEALTLTGDVEPSRTLDGRIEAMMRVDVDSLGPASCAADFNGVGGVSLQDLFDFLAAWFALDPSADFNASGTVSIQDLFDFLGAWFAGCA